MYTETIDHNIKDKQGELYPETTNVSQSTEDSNHEVENASEHSSDSERQIDVITRGESGEKNYPDSHNNDIKSLSSSDRRSSSCSLSESSNDFFRTDAPKFTESDASALVSKSDKNYVSSSESSVTSEVENSPPVPISTYQVYNLAYSQKGMSPTISPPIQVMDRSGRFDSTRIPSSIFERNTNPSEWSIASNDSLFSIHIGHNSFTRGNTFKFGELSMSQELTKHNELNMFNQIPSVTKEEIDITRKSTDVENRQTKELSEESFKFEQKFRENQNDVKNLHQAVSCKSSKSSMSSLSHETGTIGHSFVPLKKRSRRLRYCCNCSWTFCPLKWPTCCHTWPSCKCSCGWLFCSCFNCCHTKNSDRASPILTETEGNSFVQSDTPRKQSYKEESETTSNSSSSCWYRFRSKQACAICSNSSYNCSWFHRFSCPSCTFKLSCTRCKCCC